MKSNSDAALQYTINSFKSTEENKRLFFYLFTLQLGDILLHPSFFPTQDRNDVSFAVTRIDEERGVAVGIITRIIPQNL